MGLYEDFQNGTGIFGFTALTNERKLARAVAPGLAGVLSQQVRANADVVGAETGANAQRDVASIRDLGDTFRTKLLNQANIDMTGMRESGANYRTRYGQDAETDRTSRTLNVKTYLDKEQRNFMGNESDKNRAQTDRHYERFGSKASAADVLALEGGPKSTTEIATPGGIRRRRDEEDGYSPYDFSSLYPGGS